MKQSTIDQLYIELTTRLPFGWMIAFTDKVVSVYSTDGELEVLLHDDTGRYLKRTMAFKFEGTPRLIKMVRDQMDEMILKLFVTEGATKQ